MWVRLPLSPYITKLSILDALVSIATLVSPTDISIIIIIINLIVKVLIEKKEGTMITIKGVNCSVYVGNLYVGCYCKDRVLYRFAVEV